jgi:beta-carotene 3-hydroxylase
MVISSGVCGRFFLKKIILFYKTFIMLVCLIKDINKMTQILITLLFFFFMEFIAWFSHKYVMHGFMWFWHESHHKPRKGTFELNDLFGFMFAIPSAWLIILGSEAFDWRFFAGIGIALYGVAYFLVHDVFVHQRVKWLRVARLKYFKAMRQTHHLHHEVHTKEGAEAFGFLFVPKRYLNKYGRD